MKFRAFAPAIGWIVIGATVARAAAGSLAWTELPPLPDPIGFAAPFAGVAQGSLIVAGGANFPDGRPWNGARKVWHDRVFVLDTPTSPWREAGRLPWPVGYGVAVTVPDGVLCLGGSNEREHLRTAFRIRIEDDRIRCATFPSLPRPLANAAGALVGTSVFVMGGIERPDAAPGRQLWAFDLAARAEARRWRELPACPGRPRMLAVAGVHAGELLVFGGTDLVPDGHGRLKREYLRDAWRYSPAAGWKRLADMPEPRAAAPSPALVTSRGELLVLGGDDGRFADQVDTLRDAHPGFSAEILAYDVSSDTWRRAGGLPKSPGPNPATNPAAGVWPAVTTTVVSWHGGYVVPTGEIRPAVRTPRVWMARPVGEAAEPR